MNAPGPADIRQANAVACIQALRTAPTPLTIAGLTSATGLSRTTVDAVIVELEERGIVAATSSSETTRSGGRPARRYALDASHAVVAGVDAGPRNLRVVLADLGGQILAVRSDRFPADATAHERVQRTADLVTACLDEASIPRTRLGAACVAVSGIVGADGRIANSFAVPQWTGAPLAEQLSEMLGCAVMLENDIKLAALAEHHMGCAQDVDNIVFAQIGNRISIALTLDRQILQGEHRSAGEVASLRGMRWTKSSVRGELTWRSAGSAEEVLALAQQGDADALAEVRGFVEEIAPLLTTVVLVADPARMVIGGGLSRDADLFVDMLRERIHHLTMLDVAHDVRPSSLGSIGTACGAVALAFLTGSAILFGIPGVPVPPMEPPR